MNRKASITTLLIEVVSLLIFGMVVLTWFGGLESLIGGYSESAALSGFRRFLEPIEAVCRGATNEALALDLSISTFGRTNIISQVYVPQNFLSQPEDAGMLPAQMRKCVGANCLCLFQLDEWEGNWAKCTTSDWDSTILADAKAPGCPFWYYSPPGIMEQLLADTLALLDLGTTILTNEVIELIEGVERNVYFYSAPEYFGGCALADRDNITISSFTSDTATFDCDLLINHDIYDLLGEGAVTVKNRINNNIIIDKSSELQELINTDLTDYLADRTELMVTNSIIDSSPESISASVNSEVSSLLEDSVKTGFSNLEEDISNTILYFVLPDLGLIPVQDSGSYDDDLVNCPSCTPDGCDCTLNPSLVDLIMNDDLMWDKASDVTAVGDGVLSVFAKMIYDELNESLGGVEGFYSYPDLGADIHNRLISNISYSFNDTLDRVNDEFIYELAGTVCNQVYNPIGEVYGLSSETESNVRNNFTYEMGKSIIFDELEAGLREHIDDLSYYAILCSIYDLDELVFESILETYSARASGNDLDPLINLMAEKISSRSGGDVVFEDALDAVTAYSVLLRNNLTQSYNKSLQDNYVEDGGTCYLPSPGSFKSLIFEGIYDAMNENEFNDYYKTDIFKTPFFNDLNALFNDYTGRAVNEFLELIFNEGYLGDPYPNFKSLISNLVDDLVSDFNLALMDAVDEALEPGEVSRVKCWPGPSGLHSRESDFKGWFKGYSNINDLLSLNRYTSTARLVPQLLSNLNPFFKSNKALLVFFSGEEIVSRVSDSFTEKIEDVLLTPHFTLSITGFSIKSKILKKIASGLIKNFLKGLVKKLAGMAAGYFFNLAIASFYSDVFDSGGFVEEIMYADGAIRTFNPNRMRPISCVRLDELGCGTNELIWVNESNYCYTRVVLRELGDLDLWIDALGSIFGLASEDWYCNNKDVELGPLGQLGTAFENVCNYSVGEACYRNTMTACFSFTCDDVCESASFKSGLTCEEKQVRAFQYWVGAYGDPAGFGGPFIDNINKLSVKRYGESDYAWSNGIVLTAEGVYPAFD